MEGNIKDNRLTRSEVPDLRHAHGGSDSAGSEGAGGGDAHGKGVLVVPGVDRVVRFEIRLSEDEVLAKDDRNEECEPERREGGRTRNE